MNDVTLITTSLAAAERNRLSVYVAIQKEKQRHAEAMRLLMEAYTSAAAQCERMVQGLDEQQIALARTVITVRGTYRNAGKDREQQVEAAITDLLAGAPELRSTYFGTKNYDCWVGQAVRLNYGYRPAHGSVVFAIGLTDKRIATIESRPLTDAETSAAVYYLRNLDKIQQAELAGEAKATALA